MTEKSEKESIDEMKETIHATSLKVARQVTKSAFSFLDKKGWINTNNNEIELFFSERIPQVLSEKISKSLNTDLGLDLDPLPKD